MLGTAFLPSFPVPFSTRGTPRITRGSLMRPWSSLAGIRQITLRYSPLKVPVGLGTAALRHMWSDVLSRKGVEDLAKKDAVLKPLFFLASIISSSRRIEGVFGRVISRSWMNSLNAGKSQGWVPFPRKNHGECWNIPCVSLSIATYSACSAGRLRMNPFMSKL